MFSSLRSLLRDSVAKATRIVHVVCVGLDLFSDEDEGHFGELSC